MIPLGNTQLIMYNIKTENGPNLYGLTFVINQHFYETERKQLSHVISEMHFNIKTIL